MDLAGPGQAGPHQEVTSVSCQELGHYLLLENITALWLNGKDFSTGLRNHSRVMGRSCRGGPDSDRGTLVKQELKFLVSSMWYFMGTWETLHAF